MAFRSDLDALVLAAIGEGAKHGHGIVKWIRVRSEGALNAGEAQLYPVLHRLEEDGCLSAEWIHEEGKPSRKVFSLTDKGTKVLARLVGEWRAFRAGVDRLILGEEV
jgi:PadR family transcriptional regulator PadR